MEMGKCFEETGGRCSHAILSPPKRKIVMTPKRPLTLVGYAILLYQVLHIQEFSHAVAVLRVIGFR
jgi:hypothetical protein